MPPAAAAAAHLTTAADPDEDICPSPAAAAAAASEEEAAPPALPAPLPPPPATAEERVERAWAHWRRLGAPRLVVAPMVDNSELPFRMLCRRYGAGAAYTPMLHSRIFSENEKHRDMEFTTCKVSQIHAYGCSRSPPGYDPALAYPNLRIPIQNLLQPACNLDDASDLDVWNSPWQMQIGGIVALMLIVRMGFEYSYVFTTSQQWCHELAKVNTNSWNHNFEVDVCWVVLNCSISPVLLAVMRPP
jgi:hypothetical protein